MSLAAEASYYVQIGGAWDSIGAYVLTVSPEHRYDKFEPNDDIQSPKSISLRNHRREYHGQCRYGLLHGESGSLTASLKNNSTTLKPGITVYDEQKNQIESDSRGTAGADLDLKWQTQPNAVYYIQVAERWSTSGAYSVTVK